MDPPLASQPTPSENPQPNTVWVSSEPGRAGFFFIQVVGPSIVDEDQGPPEGTLSSLPLLVTTLMAEELRFQVRQTHLSATPSQGLCEFYGVKCISALGSRRGVRVSHPIK